MKISIEEFRAWEKSPTTKLIMKSLNLLREDINISMTNADVITADDSSKRLMRLLGIREGLDLILQISYENLEENDNDEADTSGT